MFLFQTASLGMSAWKKLVPTWHSRRKQLQQIVPEVQLVPRDKEARAKKECSPQAQKHFIRQRVFCSAPPLQSDSLWCSIWELPW